MTAAERFVELAISQIGKPYQFGPVHASVNAGDFTPNLVTIPNVELLEVGEDWETSTGLFTWDEADLLSSIECQVDPSIRTPVLKLGHADPRFDGQPAFGRIINMRTTNNGQTLVGDLAGVPAWLASIMPTAYPRRSIEGWFNYQAPVAGTQRWPFVLTALALLGDAYPAINTLEDLQILWGPTPPPLEPVEDVEELVAASDNGYIRAMRRADMVSWLKTKRGEEVTAAAGQPGGVKAASSIDDVRRAFYDSLDGPEQYWWWIRQVLVNPFQLVVDDDDGGLMLIDVSVDGSDNITFGEPQQVKVEYVAAASSNFAEMHKQGQIVAANWGDRVAAGAKDKNNNEEEQGIVLTDDALRALGLQPGATEQQISEAILARALGGDGNGGEGDGNVTTEGGGDGNGDGNVTSEPGTTTTTPGGGDGGTTTAPATPAPATPAPTTQPGSTTSSDLPVAAGQQTTVFTPPAGTVLVDEAQWAQVQAGAAAGLRVAEQAAQQERDRIMESAVMAGKFPRSRIPHYQQAWAADAEGTRVLINSLPDGLVPVTERGTSAGETDPTVEAGAAQYPESWKNDRRVRAMAQATATRVKVVND